MDTNKSIISPKRDDLLSGVHQVATVVGSTLGKKGTNVGIAKATPQGQVYERVVVHDGVTVAKAVNLPNEAENFGAQVVIEAAQATVDAVGDGTTVTMILADAFITEAEKLIATGISRMSVRDTIEADIKRAIPLLEKMAIPVTTLEQKIQVATISCEESELGRVIGETIHELGTTGVVTVEKSKNGETAVEHQEGMQWDKGFASPYMVTEATTKTATVENSPILVTDMELNNFKAFMPFLESFLKKGNFLTIVAPSFGGDFLPSIVVNKLEGRFIVLCLKAPSFGDLQKDFLQDIAILTGATLISEEKGDTMDSIMVEHLGKASRVSASMDTSLIAGGKGDSKLIASRVSDIEELLEKNESPYEEEKLRERLAKLTNGVSVIKVGGRTDIEIKERYEKALDGVLATRQAVKHGIVPGGEVVYLPLIAKMESPLTQQVLERPFRQLMTNSGYDAGQMLERLSQAKEGSKRENLGVDVTNGEIKDMITVGIIDPVSVSLNALQNAASVAVSIITTGATITPYEKPNTDTTK